MKRELFNESTDTARNVNWGSVRSSWTRDRAHSVCGVGSHRKMVNQSVFDQKAVTCPLRDVTFAWEALMHFDVREYVPCHCVGLKFSHRIRPDLSFDDLIRLYEVKALRCSSSRPDPVTEMFLHEHENSLHAPSLASQMIKWFVAKMLKEAISYHLELQISKVDK